MQARLEYIEGDYSFSGRPQALRCDSFQERYPYEAYEEHQEVQRDSMLVPVSLVTDLRHMVNDYYKRFPDSHIPVPLTPGGPGIQVAPPPPVVTSLPVAQVAGQAPRYITIQDDYIETVADNQPEEGELMQDTDLLG